jgi:hypothetical protein
MCPPIIHVKYPCSEIRIVGEFPVLFVQSDVRTLKLHALPLNMLAITNSLIISDTVKHA